MDRSALDSLLAGESDDEDVNIEDVDLEALLKEDSAQEPAPSEAVVHEAYTHTKPSYDVSSISGDGSAQGLRVDDIIAESDRDGPTGLSSPTLSPKRVTSSYVIDAGRLQLADLREQRLLQSGVSEIFSPLDGKRKMRSDNSSGGVVLKSLDAVSRQLQKNASVQFQHSPGLPTALAVNAKFIAVGTDKGLVIVFDHFHEIRHILGSGTETGSQGPVTTLDLTSTDFLVAGFVSGKVVLWDAVKGGVIKAVDLHDAPITAMRFVQDMTIVSVDARGCVNKTSFSKTMWLSYSNQTECLLDGSAGQVPALSVLRRSTTRAPLIAMSSERSSFVVATDPTVKVVFKWPRPPQVPGIEECFLPCISWSDATTIPTLARGWGTTIEFLEKVDDGFVVQGGLVVNKPVLALEWLGSGLISYLDASYSLHVVDAVNLKETNCLDASSVQLVFAGYVRAASEASAPNEKKEGESFINSIRCSNDGELYLLGHSSVQVLRVQNWNQRIETLVEDGEWLEALALSLDHYESNLKQISSRARGDSSNVPAAERQMADLLLRYVKLAMENAPVQRSNPRGKRSGKIDLQQSHYQMIGGVCVEFCVELNRLDLLFGEVFAQFAVAGHVRVLIEILEPFLLNGKITYVAPEVMNALVENATYKGDLSAVERVLLHLDPKMLDFEGLVRLLKHHHLYSGLCHVFARGLDDFATPLVLMLDRLIELADVPDSVSSFETVGFKALLFLQYTFKGRGFPTGEVEAPRARLAVRELVDVLVQRRLTASSAQRLQAANPALVGAPFPYLRVLLRLDYSSTLLVFEAIFETAGKFPPPLSDPLVLVTALADVLLCLDGDGVALGVDGAAPMFLSQISKYIEAGNLRPPSKLTDAVMRNLAGSKSPTAQDSLCRIISSLHPSSFDRSSLLLLVEGSGFSRAALALYKGHDCALAVLCYLRDPDTAFKKSVFPFISSEIGKSDAAVLETLRSTVISNIEPLMELDPLSAAKLVARLFPDDLGRVLHALAAAPRLQYRLLNAVAYWSSEEVDDAVGQQPLLTPEHVRLLIQGMAQYEPDALYKFLSTHLDYNVEECIRLCKQYNIAEAEAYLLERNGDAIGALHLILTNTEKHLESLKNELKQFSKSDLIAKGFLPQGHSLSGRSAGTKNLLVEWTLGEAVLRNVSIAIEICQRASSEGVDDRSLWNSMLDRLLMTKSTLKLESCSAHHKAMMEAVLTEVMQRASNKMSEFVPLARIVRRITDDHSDAHLGELRSIILSVLDTSSYECTIFQTSVSLLASDLHRLMDKRKKTKCEGFLVQSIDVDGNTYQAI